MPHERASPSQRRSSATAPAPAPPGGAAHGAARGSFHEKEGRTVASKHRQAPPATAADEPDRSARRTTAAAAGARKVSSASAPSPTHPQIAGNPPLVLRCCANQTAGKGRKLKAHQRPANRSGPTSCCTERLWLSSVRPRLASVGRSHAPAEKNEKVPTLRMGPLYQGRVSDPCRTSSAPQLSRRGRRSGLP